MRRLNRKLLLGLVVGVAATAAGVHVLHGLQSGRSANALIRQAGRAEKEGDRGKAARYLERYLSYAPGDAEARARYGTLMMPDDPRSSPRAARAALSTLEKALVRDPGLTDVRRRVIGVLMKLGGPEDYTSALSHLDVLAASTPAVGGLEAERGECLEALGRDEAAARAYEKARRDDPHRVEAYARLAGLLRRRLRRADAADRVMDALAVKDGLIAANGGSAQAYLARARYRREFRLPGVADDASRALELAPDDAEALLNAADVALTRGEKGRDEAKALLQRGAKAHPGDGRMYQALASLEAISGRPAGAIAAYERGAKALPNSLEMRWLLTDALLSGGKLDEAAGSLQRLGASTGVRPEVRGYLEARLQMGRGLWADAAATLERAAPVLAAGDAMTELAKKAYLLLGRCYASLGNADQQATAFRRAADIALPGAALDVEARLGLAGALEAREKYDEAAATYRKILALPTAPPVVRLALARLYVHRDLQAAEPQRQWSEAEQALDDADRALPGSPDVAMLRAEVLAARGKPEEAARLIASARGKAPDRVDLWLAQVELARRAGKADEALGLIDEAERRLGRQVGLLQARAVFWARRGGPEAVEALAAMEGSAAGLAAGDRRQFLRVLADAYTRVGETGRARRVSRRLADEEPNDLTTRLVLFDQALADDDARGAEGVLGEVRRLDPEKSLALYCEAVLLIHRASKDKGVSPEPARRLLGEAARLRPGWPRPALAEARVDEIQGHPEAALGHYLRAIEQGDQTPSAVLRAAQLLFERERYAQANQVLLKLRSQTALTGDQQRLVADLALRSRDYDRAIAQARGAVAADPKDFRNPLGLGRILFTVAKQDEADGRPSGPRLAEAEQALRKAVGLAKGDPTPRVALVLFLTSTGRKAQALEVIRQAEGSAPTGRDLLALAQCYEAVGDAAEAAGRYRAALSAAPDDPLTLHSAATFDVRAGRVKDAEASLRKLAGLGDKAPGDAAWARRTLALLVAGGRDPKRVTEALDILGGADGRGPDRPGGAAGVEDRRARAAILASQTSKAQRREAIGILDGLVREGAATPADRQLLAQVLEAEGEWPRARDLYRGLLTADADNPQLVAAYVLLLLRHKAYADAEPWVARIEKRLPDSPAATELRARLLHARGRKTEAVALVDAFVKGKDAQVLPFARLLEGLGEFTAAEAYYRKAASLPKQPGAPLEWIAYLGRRGRTREALDLCDAAWATSPPAEVSALSLKVLTDAGGADDADYQRVAARLEEAVKKNPKALTIRFDLGGLRTYQGRFADAEACYRAFFERNPTVAAPLNNIAWLLALQDGKGAEALATIERAISMEGEVPSLLDTRAIAYLSVGRPADAVLDLDRAIAARPTADLYFHLARAHLLAGDRDAARAALGKAKELGLKAAEVHPLERPTYERLLAELAKP